MAAPSARLAATAATHGGEDEALPSQKTTVAIYDTGFRPPKVTIPVDSRVTFVNGALNGNTAQSLIVPPVEYDLRVFDRQNKFDTHTLQPGEAQSVEFDTPNRATASASLAWRSGLLSRKLLWNCQMRSAPKSLSSPTAIGSSICAFE